MSQDIRVKEWKNLAAASGGICAFPGCDSGLLHPINETDTSFLGQAAHIVGDSRQGPRGRSELSDEDRDKASNLILLCGLHHKIIDDDPRTYSVPVLRQLKRDHEEAIRFRNNGRPAIAVPTTRKIETIHSTLLPVTHLPEVVFAAPTEYRDRQENEAKQRVIYPFNRNELTPFLIREGALFAFQDLRDLDNPFAQIADPGGAEMLRSVDLWRDPEGRRRYVNLMNRSLYKYTARLRIRFDPQHHRFYFPAGGGNSSVSVTHRSLTGRRSTRKVAWEPQRKSTGKGKGFWFHLAAGLRFHQMGDQQWCLSIRPERHLTRDGVNPLPPEQIGRRVTKLKARMYNDLYLAEVNFWREYLADGSPRIIFSYGQQSMIVDAKLLHFEVDWLGITGDDRPFTNRAGQEDLFSLADWNAALEGERIDWDEMIEADTEADDDDY